jgi:hypothetical protein
MRNSLKKLVGKPSEMRPLGRIILKLILQTQGARVWTELK